MKKTKKQKKVKKASAPARRSQELVIKVQSVPVKTPSEKDLEAEQEGSKYMIPKTWVSERQVLKMVQRTPREHVFTRAAKGGGRWDYVTGNYVTKVLNFTFGWNWDFKIVAHGVEGEQIWVQGELTVKDDKSHTITKSQFGRADIKFKQGTKIMLDFGNDLKSASTDSLKKCASLLGIASDIYGKTEFKEETGTDVGPTPTKAPEALPQGNTAPKPAAVLGQCEVRGCTNALTPAEVEYSKKMFKGRVLCPKHQK